MELDTRAWRRGDAIAALGWLLLGCGPSVATMTDADGSGTAASTAATRDTDTSTGPAGGTSATTGSLDGSSSGAPESVVCESPEPILQLGVEEEVPTGWERCASGLIRRVMPVTCESPLPRGFSCSAPSGECTLDTECTERPYGRCKEFGGFPPSCECVYGCATDDDCGDDEVCACGGNASGYPINTGCVPSTCVDDASCGAGLCAIGSTFYCNRDLYRAACTTAMDACRIDEDCDGTCYPQDEGIWACEPPGPVCASASPP